MHLMQLCRRQSSNVLSTTTLKKFGEVCLGKIASLAGISDVVRLRSWQEKYCFWKWCKLGQSVKEVATITGHTGSVRSCAFSPDGQKEVMTTWWKCGLHLTCTNGCFFGHLQSQRTTHFDCEGRCVVHWTFVILLPRLSVLWHRFLEVTLNSTWD